MFGMKPIRAQMRIAGKVRFFINSTKKPIPLHVPRSKDRTFLHPLIFCSLTFSTVFYLLSDVSGLLLSDEVSGWGSSDHRQWDTIVEFAFSFGLSASR